MENDATEDGDTSKFDFRYLILVVNVRWKGLGSHNFYFVLRSFKMVLLLKREVGMGEWASM